MATALVLSPEAPDSVRSGLNTFYDSRIEDLSLQIAEKLQTIKRLEAQRNELNSRGQPTIK